MSRGRGSAGAMSGPPQLKGFKKETEDSEAQQENVECT
jgi:hypothetical protein